MDTLKKIGRFISSMHFAILLLVVLIIACAAGSFITQGQTFEWYASRYSERAAGAILALRLDDVFHSWYFLLIAAFLCVNLLLCSLSHLPSVWKNWKRLGSPSGKGSVTAVTGDCDDRYFHEMGFRNIRELPVGGEKPRIRFSSRGQAGVFGAWVCHLGILLLILGFGLGQSLKKEYSVYGVPGQSKEIGNTGYILSIDDFRTERNEDGSVRQYSSDLTVRDVSGGESESGSAGVNEPASLFGMKLYQNSTGWAASVHIRKDGEALQDEVLCAGEFAAVKDKPELVIYLNAVYPDYVLEDGRPGTLSNEPKNPAYLYSVYYQGSILGMNALMEDEELTIDEYTVTFDQPQEFTLIQVKRDPFAPLALIGGLVTLAGLILALYVQPAQMWAEEEPDGCWRFSASCRKGGAIFEERFREVFAEDIEKASGDGSKEEGNKE